MPTAPLHEIVSAYCAAWNVAGDAERRALLEQCWAEDGAYTDPRTDLEGRVALFEHISRVRSGRPGSRIILTSGLDEHHGTFRFGWKLVNAEGATVVEGIDFGEVAPDGRLRRIIGYFGPLPAG